MISGFLLQFLLAFALLLVFVTIVEEVFTEVIEQFAGWKKWRPFIRKNPSTTTGKWDMLIGQAQIEAREATSHMKHARAIQEMKAQAEELKTLLELIDLVDWTDLFFRDSGFQEFSDSVIPKGTIPNADYELEFFIDAINHFLYSPLGRMFLALKEGEQKPFLSPWIEGVVHHNELPHSWLPIASIDGTVLFFDGGRVQIMPPNNVCRLCDRHVSRANLYSEPGYFKTMNSEL